jgi:hypothetical protein
VAKRPLEPIECQVECEHGKKCFRRYPSTHRFHMFPERCCPAIERDPPAGAADGNSNGAENQDANEEAG